MTVILLSTTPPIKNKVTIINISGIIAVCLQLAAEGLKSDSLFQQQLVVMLMLAD